jgi:ABC-2 type transport system ATP-binding protein
MSQKLQFVTTVLHEPKLIVLDEPFSGLDPVNANLIKDEIFNLAGKGSSIIFSTHRMEQVEEICDHIVLVNKGKKILDGGVQQVKQQFKENLFRIGFESLPASSLSNSFEIIKKEDHSLIVKINERYRPNDVLQYFLQQDTSITAFNEILPSLNDIFIKLVADTHTVASSNLNRLKLSNEQDLVNHTTEYLTRVGNVVPAHYYIGSYYYH